MNRYLRPDTTDTGISKTAYRYRDTQSVAELRGSATDEKKASPTSHDEQFVRETGRHAAPVSNRWAYRKATPKLFVAVLVLLAATLALFWSMNKSKLPGSEASVKSIAVLPFKPLAADSRNESLELGMAETLINKLSGVKRLIVRPLGMVRKYTGLEQDPLAAGRELGADFVLDGNLQMEGENIRATVRLLSVKDETAVWTDVKCEKACTNLFELQDAIAGRIAIGLALQLAGDQRRQLEKHYTDNIEAYHLYNLGMYSFQWNRKEDFEKSIDYYQQAIQKDPNYALAYVRLAETYRSMESRGFVTREEAEQKGKSALYKALAIDDTIAEAHAVLGSFKSIDFDWAEAEKEMKRALELDPNSALANITYAGYLVAVGRPDEALEYAIRAHELDPASNTPGSVAYPYFISRNFDKAIELWREALEKKPDLVQPHLFLGEAYLAKGMYDESVEEIGKAVALDNAPERWDRHPMLAYAYAAAGKRDEALRILDEQHRLAKRRYISPYNFAIIYTGLGDKDRAFEYLEMGLAKRARLIERVKVRPIFDPLRSDPRYVELLRRMNLQP